MFDFERACSHKLLDLVQIKDIQLQVDLPVPVVVLYHYPEGVDCRSEMAFPFSPVSSTLNYNLAIANIQIRDRYRL